MIKINKTLKTFGYPETLVKEYGNWVVLLRKEQTTLGSLVLICTENVIQFSKISYQAYHELPQIIKEVEEVLKILFKYDKINYLMLFAKYCSTARYTYFINHFLSSLVWCFSH